MSNEPDLVAGRVSALPTARWRAGQSVGASSYGASRLGLAPIPPSDNPPATQPPGSLPRLCPSPARQPLLAEARADAPPPRRAPVPAADKPSPPRQQKKCTFKLPHRLHKRLKSVAERQGRYLYEVAREAIEQYLQAPPEAVTDPANPAAADDQATSATGDDRAPLRRRGGRTGQPGWFGRTLAALFGRRR